MPPVMGSLVLLRHGLSAWNQANTFTGWMDVDLTPRGEREARQAGRFLREAGLAFDLAYTSLLKRAIRTLWIALEALDQPWLPVIKDWRLNERHYGALQGLNKAEMVDRYGRRQVFEWRRSFSVRPPALDPSDPRHPIHDPRYAAIDPALLPSTESLQDTLLRVLVCWQAEILPHLRQGRRVLVVAHSNSIRALVKHLDALPDTAVPALSVPTGIPIRYELDGQGRALGHEYIGPPQVVQAALSAAARAAEVKGRR